MMKAKMLIVTALLFSLSTTVHAYEETQSRNFKLTATGTFDLANINGDIILSTHREEIVAIEATKRADSKAEADAVEIVFTHEPGHLKVSIKRHCKRCNVRVNFRIRIPEKLGSTSLGSVNGRIDAQGGFAKLKARSVNGRLNFRGYTSEGSFSAVNGKIMVSLKERLTGDISLESVNGSIQLEIPDGSSFSFRGSTLNGSVRSDFPVKIKRGIIGQKVTGSVNGDTFDVKIKTVNGSIRLLKI